MKPVAWTDGKFCLSFAKSDVCPIPLYTASRLPAIVKDEQGKVVAVTLTNEEHQVQEVLWEAPRELSDEEKEKAKTRILANPDVEQSHLTSNEIISQPVAWMYDSGKWTVGVEKEKVWVESSDFMHDARLYIDGDFVDLPEKFAYANEIAKRLNQKPVTAPRELSDAEIEEIGEHVFGNCFLDFEVADNYLDFARAILKKASEK